MNGLKERNNWKTNDVEPFDGLEYKKRDALESTKLIVNQPWKGRKTGFRQLTIKIY